MELLWVHKKSPEIPGFFLFVGMLGFEDYAAGH